MAPVRSNPRTAAPGTVATRHRPRSPGHDVTEQDCTGRPTTELGIGERMDVPPSDAKVPDSVVIEAPGEPTLRMLSTSFPGGNDPDQFTGLVDMRITQQADAETFALDLQTLHP